MKVDHGQKMFAGAVAAALVRAWTERLGLRVVVDARGGTSAAELVDDTGRVVWSQSATGGQLELPLRATTAVTPARTTAPSPLVGITVPADASYHPDTWADEHDLSLFPEGLVRWEMARGNDEAWTFVPRAVGEQIVERLAESGVRAALEDADPQGRAMLLAANGLVAVREVQWRAVSIDANHTTLETLSGDERRTVLTSDVRWIGGFCCVAPPPKARGKAAKGKPAPKAKGKPAPTTRLWINEGDWDALSPDAREAFAAHGVEWQGAAGYVFADVPHGKPLLAVRALAQKLGVVAQDHMPEGVS